MRHPPVLLRPAATVPPPPSVVSTSSAASTATSSHAGNGASANGTGPGRVYANTTGHQLAGCSNGGGAGLAFHHASSSSPAAPTASSSSSGNSSGPTSAFSGSAPSLVGPLLPSARRYVAVRLLTGETLQFDVEVSPARKGPTLTDGDAAAARSIYGHARHSCGPSSKGATPSRLVRH